MPYDFKSIYSYTLIAFIGKSALAKRRVSASFFLFSFKAERSRLQRYGCDRNVKLYLPKSGEILVILMSLQITIDYPETLPDALQQTREEFEQEAKWAMAAKLFEMKRLSSGMAAALVGTDRVSFLLNLHRYGVAMIDLTEAELLSDLENA